MSWGRSLSAHMAAWGASPPGIRGGPRAVVPGESRRLGRVQRGMARTRTTPLRAAAAAAMSLLALLLLGAAPAPRYEKRIEAQVDTPVYRLAGDLPVHAGEQYYRLHWSGFPVARVKLAMAPDPERGGVGVEILGATHPVIDWLWRYRFEGHGLVRTDPFAPGGFVVDECENHKYQRTEIRFGEPDHGVRGIRLVRGRTKEYVFHSDNTFDIPSSVFLVLNLDYAPGARFALDTFTGKSRYLVRVEVQGRERVTLAGASYDAWRLRLLTEEITDDDPEGRHRETFVWVTSERPRQLLRASSRTFVGSIQLELLPGNQAPDDVAPGHVAPKDPARSRCT